MPVLRYPVRWETTDELNRISGAERSCSGGPSPGQPGAIELPEPNPAVRTGSSPVDQREIAANMRCHLGVSVNAESWENWTNLGLCFGEGNRHSVVGESRVTPPSWTSPGRFARGYVMVKVSVAVYRPAGVEDGAVSDNRPSM